MSIRNDMLAPPAKASYSTKLKRADFRQFKPLDAQSAQAPEKLGHPRGRQLTLEKREASGRVGHHADVRVIPLVAAASVGDLAERCHGVRKDNGAEPGTG